MFIGVRRDVAVWWCLRLGAGCLACRCVVNADVGDRPRAFGGPEVPMGTRFKRGRSERCGNAPADVVIYEGCW